MKRDPLPTRKAPGNPLRFVLHDWRKETEREDTASWPEDPIADEPREIIVTHDDSRISLTMPIPGAPDDAIELWVELQGKRLVVHCYDPEHESPVNIRIGETTILLDTHDRDAENARR